MPDSSRRRIDDATPFHAAVDWKMGALALGAAAAAAVAFRTSLTFDVNAADFNPIVAVPLLLAGYGVVQLGKAFGARRVANRFGHSFFDMSGQSVRRGERLSGSIVTGRDLVAPGGFALRLRCIERRRIRDVSSGDYRDEDRILWELSQRVQASRTATDGIPVSLAIPADAAATAGSNPLRWTLEVDASVDGARYEALFGVPVGDGAAADDEEEEVGDEAPMR